ncbi:DUF4942 domain-containing protein [Marinomonas sp. TI.3.20]|uniref:DUF4942 domain-containing protein n=1 Tax=Marinomonas sp. TI.3.20 TaxID=3121296 RepID=UPI00311E3265
MPSTNIKTISIENLKYQREDFEFYPTSPSMIECVKKDMEALFASPYFPDENAAEHLSVLDCGAGDGNVLSQLTKGKKYAIELSRALIDQMNDDIFIVGTNFLNEPLFNKTANVTFSNPPYSQFKEWMTKIINESTSQVLYFVVPKRWYKNKKILEALKIRGCRNSRLKQIKRQRRNEEPKETDKSVKVIGSFSFDNAEAFRRARVEVDVVRIILDHSSVLKADARGGTSTTDPLNQAVSDLIASVTTSSENVGDSIDQSDETNNTPQIEANPIVNLTKSYNVEKQKILDLCKSLAAININLLESVGVNKKTVIDSISTKIQELPPFFWKQLFDFYEPINQRLCSSKRENIRETVINNANIEFTESNIYAVTSWVIKNASRFIDEQICEMFDKIADPDNIILYKSNKKVFQEKGWKVKHMNIHYLKSIWREEYGKKIGLDRRIVIDGVGGGFSHSNYHEGIQGNGLNYATANLLGDFIRLANNLGFNTTDCKSVTNQEPWEAGKAKEITFLDSSGKEQTLYKARVYNKGSVHIHFHPEFVVALNVEIGRLKGWLNSEDEAAEELQIKPEQAAKYFGICDRVGKIGLRGDVKNMITKQDPEKPTTQHNVQLAIAI